MIHEYEKDSIRVKYDEDKNIVWVYSDDMKAASKELRQLLLNDWIKLLPRAIIYEDHNNSKLALLMQGEEVGKFIHPANRPKNKSPKKSFSDLARKQS